MRRLLTALIGGYSYLLSPFLGNHCRFYPSCSEYAQEAISAHGAVRGCYLSARRLLRCHPWHPGGVDPVPTNYSRRQPAGNSGAGTGGGISERHKPL